MGTLTHLGSNVSLGFGPLTPLATVSTGECVGSRQLHVMYFLELLDDSLAIKNKILGRLSLICSLPPVPNMTHDFKSRRKEHMLVDASGKTHENTIPQIQI